MPERHVVQLTSDATSAPALCEVPAPQLTLSGQVNDGVAVLWVMTGAARVRLGADAPDHEVTAGQALWIAESVAHDVRTAPGTVAVPLLWPPGEGPRWPGSTQRLAVPPAWGDRLLLHFTQMLGFLEWPDETGSVSGTLWGDGGGRSVRSIFAPPPVPWRTPVRAVAVDILAAPGSEMTLGEFAERQQLSVRQLQRHFRAETGLTFSQWRTRARVGAALDDMAAGTDIGTARRRAGYATAAGFTTALRRHCGLTPRECRSLLVEDDTHAGGAFELSPRMRTPPEVPRMRTWRRANEYHVLVLQVRGRAEVDIAGRRYDLGDREAMWLPADFVNQIVIQPGGVLLPLGARNHPMDVSLDDLPRYRFAEEEVPRLIGDSVAEYSALRGGEAGLRIASRLFYDLIEVGRDAGPTGLAARDVLGAVYRNPADGRSVDRWAAELGVDGRELAAEVMRRTGLPLPQWRAQVRMAAARRHLHAGTAPSAVARRLGYASLASFTTVFTKAHGIGPREYARSATWVLVPG